VLIDGALSSLDSLVARQILENAIKGDLCSDKVVFLVTYDLDQASEMDFILYVADDGTVSVIN
jgi:ABC-type transport system involved in cytochrome bd biosynthesis fused ATPase/permease subunit